MPRCLNCRGDKMTILIQESMERYHNMRLWCIANIKTVNSHRRWTTRNEKERTGISARHGTDYEIEFSFTRLEDEEAFKKVFFPEEHTQLKGLYDWIIDGWKKLWN